MKQEAFFVNAWEEDVIIPTYQVGEPNKNPIFSDKRVYQGSTGKVYPYPVIEKIYDEKVDKKYRAVYIENAYLKIMVLPELGGRIQRAYDKTNGYDFVYYNKVIKPALVGLTGPWISGGIEFNWPQHHRPTTFMPVGYSIRENSDGSKTILINDLDRMYGTKAIAEFTLYPDKAYLEIKGQLYNRTPFSQTFLWWANPAVSANDHTQSIFPPDVHAVMDHGKRDVSRFPIATGVYYKKDYSAGVDISRYKNIPVPTSYMAERSKYDFVGGYDHNLRAGILHIADHHISPGKKQWTWGCGDFGKAWDKNLTDEDGPYVELMTGVYTDNQPDFTWLKPFEEKTFHQYFMPYKAVGEVKNATIKAILNLEPRKDEVYICLYGTCVYENAKIVLRNKGELCFEKNTKISPIDIYEETVSLNYEKKTDLSIEVYSQDHELLVAYTPEEEKIEKIPKPAEAAMDPKKIMSNEELYLTGLHIEQYRHATYEAEDYYLEGLGRDRMDSRINNAYGLLLLRRGLFEDAEVFFRRGISRLTWKNPNPYNSEPYYNLGLCLFYQKKFEDAYSAFYKATWSNEQQEMSFYYLAVIANRNKKYRDALSFVEKALIKNLHNIRARGLKAIILRELGRLSEAKAFIEESLRIDPFDYVSIFEKSYHDQENRKAVFSEILRKTENYPEYFIQAAVEYESYGLYQEGIEILRLCRDDHPMLKYYEGYCFVQLNHRTEAIEAFKAAEALSPNYCFPNNLEDILVLEMAMDFNPEGGKAPYYLGNLYYDKKQFAKARALWEKSVRLDESFSTAFRNLSLVYYNQYDLPLKAREVLEKAFSLDTTDSRVFLELDQLYKKLGVSATDRILHCEKHYDTLLQRDDLYIEYITLLNQVGQHEKAYQLLIARKLHPWEGGEGKASSQYKIALLELAKEKLFKKQFDEGIQYLKKALVYPESIGEGKLEGTKDNHIHYYLGCAYEALGKKDLAEEYFQLASLGNQEPAGMMYYYDQPADMILYQGLALQKLERPVEAKARFYKLLDYGEQHMFDEVKIEYFAVSLPDFLIFKDDLNTRNKVHCNYLIGLANIGLGNQEKAKAAFEKALELDQNHLECILYSK